MATSATSSLLDKPVVASSPPTTAVADCAKSSKHHSAVENEGGTPVLVYSTQEETDDEILLIVPKEQNEEDEPLEDAGDDEDIVLSVKPDESDEEQGLVPTIPPTSFRQTCRFVTRLGLAAYAYGSPSFRVEAFVRSLLVEQYGYPPHHQLFAITNTECMTAFCEQEDDDPILMMQPLRRQTFNLYRLGRISAIAKSLRADDDMTLSQAVAELAAVEQAPDPFGPIALFVSYIAIGGGLAALFQGSWVDVMASLVCSIPVCGITMAVPPALAKASLFGSAAVSAALATLAADYVTPLLADDAATATIHTGIVVLSSIAVLLPGYAATLAVSELVSHHIVCGLDRFVHAIFDMLLLFAGAWSGAALLGGGLGTFASASEQTSINADDTDGETSSTPLDWLGWIVPVLLISLAVQFQTSLRDFPWVLLHLTVAFCTVFFLGNDTTNEDEDEASATANRNNRLWSGVFVAALSTTACAQLWSRWFDRPRSIVLVPCMVLLVSGSIGFRGLVTLSSSSGAPRDPDNDSDAASSVAEGLQQVLQMFLITFLILGGVTVGSVVVPTQTTL